MIAFARGGRMGERATEGEGGSERVGMGEVWREEGTTGRMGGQAGGREGREGYRVGDRAGGRAGERAGGREGGRPLTAQQ